MIDPLDKTAKNLLTTRLQSLSYFIPKEFQRKPRGLDELPRWKATEFRQFTLYTGLFVLKDVVSDDCYYHFLLLHCAYGLLLCQRSYKENLNSSKSLLKYFVELFPSIYLPNSVTYNVHNLLHVCESVANIGFLKDFSAYSFENYMQVLKKSIRKPTQILQQLAKKLPHHNLLTNIKEEGFKKLHSGKIKSYATNLYSLSLLEPDCFCCIDPDINIKIIQFNEKDKIIVGTRFNILGNFFETPLKSKELGIYIAEENKYASVENFPINKIIYKNMCLPYDAKLLIIPILHTYQ